MTGPMDTISSEEPTGPLGRRTRDLSPAGFGVRATAMSAALTLVVAAGVATAAYRSSSSSTSPASLIPANAFAVAAADLSLPGGQSDALETMLGRFPGIHLTGDGSLRDRILRSMLKSAQPSINYDSDVKPWLGDHVAIAGWNHNGQPEMEVLLQSSDDASARSHLTTLLDGKAHVAFHDGYAVLGNTQTAVDDAIAAADHSSLADTGPYSGDIAALPDNEAITAWFDGPEAKQVLGGTAMGGPGGALAFSGLGVMGPGMGKIFQGRVALGVHVTDTVAELDVRGVGVTPSSTSAPSTMLTDLPSSTIGALELGGPGALVDAVTPLLRVLGGFATGATFSCSNAGTPVPSIATAPIGGISRRQLLHQLRTSIPPGSAHRKAIIRSILRRHDRAVRQMHRLNKGKPLPSTGVPMPGCYSSTTPPQPTDPFAAIQKAIGISFPDDVKTILGDRAVVSFGGLELAGAPDIAVRSHPTDLSAAQSLAQTLSSHVSAETPLSIDVSTAGDDLILATSSSYGQEVAKVGGLGDQAQVKTALDGMPDTVSMAAYVDLSRVWPLIGSGVPAGVQHLHAIGFWASTSGDVQTGRLRLVTG